MPRLHQARLFALLLPAALLAGAWYGQLFAHLYPCEMCHWQRWGHYAALALAVLAFVPRAPGQVRALVLLAALGVLVSGAIGVFHAGVEYGWWRGFTQCTSTISGKGSSADILKEIMAAPTIRCDQVQWSLFGISLAGWNAIFSIGGAIVIVSLALRRRR